MEAAAAKAPIGEEMGPLDFEWIHAPQLVLPEKSHHREAQRKGVFRDYAGLEARNRKLGLAGEFAVVDLERRRLLREGKGVLADRIEHVSQTQGDGLGYHILSYESNGKERLIEEKTTRSRREAPFFVTRTEVEVSQEQQDVYHLVRIFEFGRKPGWYGLKGRLDATCQLLPSEFLAVPGSRQSS